jgi:hypothetical protein
MQAALRQVARHVPVFAILAALAIASAFWLPVPSQAGEAAMSVTLAPGKWKAVRLRNVPKDTVLSIAVKASGKVGVGLMTDADFRAYPSPKDPVFFGSAEPSLSFTTSMPSSGDYYLVFDNRQAAEERTAKFAIRAQRGTAASAPVPQPVLPGPQLQPAPPRAPAPVVQPRAPDRM